MPLSARAQDDGRTRRRDKRRSSPERHSQGPCAWQDARMSTNRRLGRLIINWGPQPTDGPERFERIHALRKDVHEPLHAFSHFHAHALNNDPDPFASRYFGLAVRTLVAGETVVLTDGAFEDPRRRNILERAFRQTLPDLVVSQVGPGEQGAPRPPHQGIVFDEDVYGEGGMGSNESIVVESHAQSDVSVLALQRAAQRMMLVGENGNEYGDIERPPKQRGVEICTPNYVSEVTVDQNGNPGFYIDCKGRIEPPMASRFAGALCPHPRFFQPRTVTRDVPQRFGP